MQSIFRILTEYLISVIRILVQLKDYIITPVMIKIIKNPFLAKRNSFFWSRWINKILLVLLRSVEATIWAGDGTVGWPPLWLPNVFIAAPEIKRGSSEVFPGFGLIYPKCLIPVSPQVFEPCEVFSSWDVFDFSFDSWEVILFLWSVWSLSV